MFTVEGLVYIEKKSGDSKLRMEVAKIFSKNALVALNTELYLFFIFF